jgi:hypothetical protein
MAVPGGIQVAVEAREFVVVAVLRGQAKAFARVGFDQGADHQAIGQPMVALACANQTAQGRGIRVTVAFGQSVAAPVDQFGDQYRVFNFIARYGGHRLHPVLRRVRVGVTCQRSSALLAALHSRCTWSLSRGSKSVAAYEAQIVTVVDRRPATRSFARPMMSCGVFYPQPA